MNIKAIQEIRDAEQAKKFELMIDEVCGRGAAQRNGTVLEFEQALHKLEQYRFSASPGYYLAVVPPEGGKKPSRKVIITENEFNEVVRKEYESSCGAYAFLRDYLGLDGKEPLSPEEMAVKYPMSTRPGGDADMDWCDAIVRVIFKGLRRLVYGPGKKPF